MRRGARQALVPGILLLLQAALLGGGCGRDPVRDAIRRLDGSPAEVRRAVMDLRLTSRDPVPELMAAVLHPRTRGRVRVRCVEILGDIARRQKEERIFGFLREQLHSADAAVRAAAVRGFIGTPCEAAVPDLIGLKKAADPDLLRDIEEALASTAEEIVRDIDKLWNSPEAAMAAYARAEQLGLGRGVVGYSKARFLDRQGRAAAAAALFDELGLVRRWWLIGPFPNRQGMGFHHAYPPEREINLAAEYADGYGRASWYMMDAEAPAGMVNLKSYFVEGDNVLAYALVFLVSDRERPIDIRAGSDDTLTILVNGEKVWAHEQYRAASYDDDIVPATLRQGVNTVLLKVCQDWGDWKLIARFTGPGDTPLDGVVLTLAPSP